jgi:phage-related protein
MSLGELSYDINLEALEQLRREISSVTEEEKKMIKESTEFDRKLDNIRKTVEKTSLDREFNNFERALSEMKKSLDPSLFDDFSEAFTHLKSEIGTVSQESEKFAELKEQFNGLKDSLGGAGGEGENTRGKMAALGAGILAVVAVAKELFDGLMNFARASPLFSSALDQVSSQTEYFGEIVGDALAPLIEVVIGILDFFIEAWESLDEETQNNIKTLITVVGAILALATPIGQIVAALAIAIAIWNEFGDEIMAIANLVINTVIGIFEGFGQFINSFFENPFQAIFDAWDNLRNFMEGLLGPFVFLFDLLIRPFNVFIEAMRAGFHILETIWKALTGQISIEGAITDIIHIIGEFINNTVIRPINDFISMIAEVIRIIRDVDILGSKPFYGLLVGFQAQVAGAKLPVFHVGGQVGGNPGQEVPIVTKAGEWILTQEQYNRVDLALDRAISGGGNTGTVNNNQRNVTFNIVNNYSGTSKVLLSNKFSSNLEKSLRGAGI